MVRDMGKSSKKTRTTSRPARRATRAAAVDVAVATPAEPIALEAEATPADAIAVEPAMAAETPVDAPMAAEVAPAEVAPAAQTAPREVAQLAFRYFAESGYEHGHALDHWLRAETELTRNS